MQHGQGLLAGTVHRAVRGTTSIWIEQVVVIIALLDHPDDNEDNDVQEVLLDEETPDRCTDPRPVQAAIAVDSRVDGDDDVQGEGHCQHQIGLRLDLRELVRIRAIKAIVRCSSFVHVSVHSEDD